MKTEFAFNNCSNVVVGVSPGWDSVVLNVKESPPDWWSILYPKHVDTPWSKLTDVEREIAEDMYNIMRAPVGS